MRPRLRPVPGPLGGDRVRVACLAAGGLLGAVVAADAVPYAVDLVGGRPATPLAASFVAVCLPDAGGTAGGTRATHGPTGVAAAAEAAGLAPARDLDRTQRRSLTRHFAETFGAPRPGGDAAIAAAPVMTADLETGGVVSAGALSVAHDDGTLHEVCYMNGIQPAAGDAAALAGAIEARVGARLGPAAETGRSVEGDGITHRFEWRTAREGVEIAVILRHRVDAGRGFLAGAVSRLGRAGV